MEENGIREGVLEDLDFLNDSGDTGFEKEDTEGTSEYEASGEEEDTVAMEENGSREGISAGEGCHDFEKPKGEDIYVENDPDELDRMLGVSPTEQEIEEASVYDPEEDIALGDIDGGEGGISDTGKEEWSGPGDKENKKDPKDDNNEEVLDAEIEEGGYTEIGGTDPVSVNLMDFMEDDPDLFTYLTGTGDNYSIESILIDNKPAIKRAVRSESYLFRYPKLHLKDRLLGYFEDSSEDPCYIMFFPEYSIFFQVPKAYKKLYALSASSMKEYFEDLVTRIRPQDLQKEEYPDPVTITSLKVAEPGIIEVSSESGTEKYLIQNRYVEFFYNILSYIRELSDSGMSSIPLRLIPKFFVKIK